ncbi:MAG: tyrosine-type recombinase/integrase [Anaerosacchariphilus sp.]
MRLRDIRFHVLRHTFATYSLESGMRTKVLSELMGHSSVKITLNAASPSFQRVTGPAKRLAVHGF